MPDECALRAVIFDLDGVLCDTSRFHAQAWADLVRGLGYEPPADLEERVKGISRIESVKIALGEHAGQFSPQQLHDLGEQKNACYVRAIARVSPADLYPGVLSIFDELKSAGWRIVLGSASKNARPVLDALKITAYFDAIADGFSYQRGKPHPDVFWAGARMVGLTPAECVVVEDAEAGIEAALAGGFVAVGMGHPQSLRRAHLLIRSLEELNLGILRGLHARVVGTLAKVTPECIAG